VFTETHELCNIEQGLVRDEESCYMIPVAPADACKLVSSV